ncbi:MAG: hypothetical protein CSA72_05810 [Rhodobacterales bacterium]|nr:MAG: hypothetical protein CSA72_05810 [Rhodobacterales bacterium]
MGLISVLAAALVAWLLGAAYYIVLDKPWMAASGIKVGPDGKPEGQSPLPFIISAICMVIVAGMMRHIFAMAAIDTVAKGIVSGLGIGAFFISPWIFINNAYGMRPMLLSVIDAGYAVIAAGAMGLVLTLI